MSVFVKRWARGAESIPRKKKGSKRDHIPRAMELFRKAGWLIDNCERLKPSSVKETDPDTGETRWKQAGFQRSDLFGIADFEAIDPQGGLLVLLQVYGAAERGAHWRKAATATAETGPRGSRVRRLVLPLLLAGGVRVWFLGWRRTETAGGAVRWVPELWTAARRDDGRLEQRRLDVAESLGH